MDKKTDESKDNTPDKPSTIAVLKNKPKSANYTVQASIILKTPIFVPVGRVGKGNRGAHQISESSESLRHLSICAKYGYDEVIISGYKLSLEVDFKVWAGCLRAMEQFGQSQNEIVLPFKTFVDLCGYGKERINEEFRTMLDSSLARIKGLNMTFRKARQKKDEKLKSHYTSLLKSATVDEKKDVVKLEVDAELWDLYQMDYEILVSIQNLDLMGRAETAQCLYLYLSAMPSNPHPIAIERIRERLELSGTVTNQNKRIKAAFKTLSEAGLVKGKFEGARDECFLHLTSIVRKAKIAVQSRVEKEPEEPEGLNDDNIIEGELAD